MNFRFAKIASFVLVFGFAKTATAAETITYTYDALGRLVEVATVGTVNNGVDKSIEYDAAGNRIEYEVTGAP